MVLCRTMGDLRDKLIRVHVTKPEHMDDFSFFNVLEEDHRPTLKTENEVEQKHWGNVCGISEEKWRTVQGRRGRCA